MIRTLVKTYSSSSFLFWKEDEENFFSILNSADPCYTPSTLYNSFSLRNPKENTAVKLFDLAVGNLTNNSGDVQFHADDNESIIVKKNIIRNIDVHNSKYLAVSDGSPLSDLFGPNFYLFCNNFILEDDRKKKDFSKIKISRGKSLFISYEKWYGLGVILTSPIFSIETIET